MHSVMHCPKWFVMVIGIWHQYHFYEKTPEDRRYTKIDGSDGINKLNLLSLLLLALNFDLPFYPSTGFSDNSKVGKLQGQENKIKTHIITNFDRSYSFQEVFLKHYLFLATLSLFYFLHNSLEFEESWNDKIEVYSRVRLIINHK